MSTFDLPAANGDTDSRYRSRKLRIAVLAMGTATIIWFTVFWVACYFLAAKLIDAQIWATLVYQIVLWWGGMAAITVTGFGVISEGGKGLIAFAGKKGG